MSRQGTAEFFVAWHHGVPCGTVTVLRQSKYRAVRDRYGDFPELNALSAFPTRQGTGSRIITAVETWVSGRGATRIGLAVEQTNQAAFRLYTRLGYVDWGHGPVVDRWVEHDGTGRFRCHADRCFYLVKALPGVRHNGGLSGEG